MSPKTRTAVIVGSSIVVGFVGDLMIYSLAESKGKKFGIHMPKKWALFQLVALGIITGFAIDYAVKKIEVSMMSKEDKALADLVKREQEKIDAGQVMGKIPTEVVWVAGT